MIEIQTFVYVRLELVLRYDADRQIYTGVIPKIGIDFSGETIELACREAARLFSQWQEQSQ